MTPDGRTVYGARVEPTPAIVRYRLPDVPAVLDWLETFAGEPT